MTVTAEEFLRRFLLHVLPHGFVRIRFFGFLANRSRKTLLPLCHQLLPMASSPSLTPIQLQACSRILELLWTRCLVSSMLRRGNRFEDLPESSVVGAARISSMFHRTYTRAALGAILVFSATPEGFNASRCAEHVRRQNSRRAAKLQILLLTQPTISKPTI